MATPYVYRRRFDYQAPRASWLLLRPDLSVTGSVAALAITGQQSTIPHGLAVLASSQALTAVGQASTVASGLTVIGQVGTMTIAGASASLNFADTTAFTYRDVPILIPQVRLGVYRRGFTVKRSRVPIVIPRIVSTGLIAANRAELTMSANTADVVFQEQIRLWVLQEAVRSALQRRQLAYRAPLDMRPWDNRVFQFTVPTSNLTAYMRPLTLIAQASTVALSRAAAAQVAQLIITRPTAVVRLAKAISANTAAMTMAGQTARIGTGKTVTSTVANLAIAGQAASAKLGRAISANAQSLVITSLTGSLGANLNVNARVTVMAITGQTASRHLDKAVSALAAGLALDVYAATAQVSAGIPAAVAELIMEGKPADLFLLRQVNAALVQLSIDEQRALIEGTQAVIVQIGRRTIRVRARNSTVTIH
jgi:hypothetical protein